METLEVRKGAAILESHRFYIRNFSSLLSSSLLLLSLSQSERRIASGPVIFGPLGPIPVGKKPSTRERMAFISKSSLGSMVTFDHEIRRGDGDMEKEQKEEMKEGEEGERKDDADDGRASKTPSKSQRLPELNEAADDNEANPFYVAGQVKPQTPMSAPKPVWTPEMSRSRRHRTRSKKTPSSAQPALGVGRSVSPGFARAVSFCLHFYLLSLHLS